MSNYDRGHKMYGMYKWIDLFLPANSSATVRASRCFVNCWTPTGPPGS